MNSSFILLINLISENRCVTVFNRLPISKFLGFWVIAVCIMVLPVPVLSSFNEKFASKLYSENYEALCFARDIRIVGSPILVNSSDLRC